MRTADRRSSASRLNVDSPTFQPTLDLQRFLERKTRRTRSVYSILSVYEPVAEL